MKAAFNQFVVGNKKLRELARQHGEVLIELRDECKRLNLNFTDVLVESEIPKSTAYEHIRPAAQ